MSQDQDSQLRHALQIPSRLEPKPFAQFLRRLAIALKTRGQNPFTDEDIQYLLEQFELSTSEFDEMFSSCQYVFQQAACFNLDGDKIAAYVTQSGGNEDTAECFRAVWDAEGDELSESLKGRTMSQDYLQSSTWRLHLKADGSEEGKQRKPVTLIGLNVGESEQISIQFTHDELSKFYDQIEKIQQEIDRLT